MKSIPVLYLDLDGTVRKGFDEIGKFVNSAKDVEVFDGVPQLISTYKIEGFRVVGITNQGGLALGHLKEKDLIENIAETNSQCMNLFDIIMACRHHPDSKDKEFAICWCRKPRIGNIVTACHELCEKYPDECYPPHLALFVGDRPEDKQCAANAGIKFKWAKDWRKSNCPADINST